MDTKNNIKQNHHNYRIPALESSTWLSVTGFALVKQKASESTKTSSRSLIVKTN